jgi:hypothetical protein
VRIGRVRIFRGLNRNEQKFFRVHMSSFS